mmetsp:Transcript_14542/g.26333  ORF Transcript_14542/g.26333 Transcript_14542/m.26333 type:complete len:332 (-) Transcript_14542:298-1293(-)|eukprot:CAMPEP_0202495840 /NCGR_PEP_ID=MMETSP1361-20130828/17908_1 /ASSEMBLY_ACC=CAM_ASM_000849 /TAXON_ID=210615 /ORGANISM="Staurosira complex sp., Strain CCMP2646" /LENGTH=331 /DNA_ID=CAMNT_0049126985 /DNA_START=4 /DNA_END=999 /DNA_ORIENTATION=+
MTILKKAMTRRRNEKSSASSNPHLRSRSQERALAQQDALFESLEKRYLSHSCSSTDSSTDEESPMTAPLTERKRFCEDTTIPRFPVGSQHDKHCWSEPSHSIYSVRGDSYLEDGQKVESGPYLLRARGCDLLLSSNGSEPPCHVGRYPHVLGGTLRSLPTFIFKFRLPWGVLPLYFEIPTKLAIYLRPNPPPVDASLSPSERTLAKFFRGNDDYKNSTLKLIPFIPQGPWIVKNMVSGKPAIIGNKLPVTYTYVAASEHGAEYLEADLDIGSSSATAKRIVSVCRRYMNLLTVDIGLVIQGNFPDELPEQMMGSIRLHGVDPQKAPTLDGE